VCALSIGKNHSGHSTVTPDITVAKSAMPRMNVRSNSGPASHAVATLGAAWEEPVRIRFHIGSSLKWQVPPGSWVLGIDRRVRAMRRSHALLRFADFDADHIFGDLFAVFGGLARRWWCRFDRALRIGFCDATACFAASGVYGHVCVNAWGGQEQSEEAAGK
jgi:hypothetical protein